MIESRFKKYSKEKLDKIMKTGVPVIRYFYLQQYLKETEGNPFYPLFKDVNVEIKDKYVKKKRMDGIEWNFIYSLNVNDDYYDFMKNGFDYAKIYTTVATCFDRECCDIVSQKISSKEKKLYPNAKYVFSLDLKTFREAMNIITNRKPLVIKELNEELIYIVMLVNYAAGIALHSKNHDLHVFGTQIKDKTFEISESDLMYMLDCQNLSDDDRSAIIYRRICKIDSAKMKHFLHLIDERKNEDVSQTKKKGNKKAGKKARKANRSKDKNNKRK